MTKTTDLSKGPSAVSVRIDELFEKLSPVLSVKDLTELLGKDRATVYRWLKKGELPGVLVNGTTWVIYRDEVKDYLWSRHNQAGTVQQENAAGGDDAEPVEESLPG